MTFDCYGTLIDWDGGMGSFLYQVALRSGDDAPPPGDYLRREWEAIQFEVIGGEYRSYKQVLRESVRDWCFRRGYTWEESLGGSAVTAMRAFQPFHDTMPALRRAQEAGLQLAIISNTDHDIINHSLNHMRGLEFDEVITAEDCGAYKPATRNFDVALERIGVPASEVLHVAFGFKYDIGPALQRGLKTAWVNRNAEQLEPGDPQPDYIWRDLWGLAELVGEPYHVGRTP